MPATSVERDALRRPRSACASSGRTRRAPPPPAVARRIAKMMSSRRTGSSGRSRAGSTRAPRPLSSGFALTSTPLLLEQPEQRRCRSANAGCSVWKRVHVFLRDRDRLLELALDLLLGDRDLADVARSHLVLERGVRDVARAGLSGNRRRDPVVDDQQDDQERPDARAARRIGDFGGGARRARRARARPSSRAGRFLPPHGPGSGSARFRSLGRPGRRRIRWHGAGSYVSSLDRAVRGERAPRGTEILARELRDETHARVRRIEVRQAVAVERAARIQRAAQPRRRAA